MTKYEIPALEMPIEGLTIEERCGYCSYCGSVINSAKLVRDFDGYLIGPDCVEKRKNGEELELLWMFRRTD